MLELVVIHLVGYDLPTKQERMNWEDRSPLVSMNILPTIIEGHQHARLAVLGFKRIRS